MKKKFTAFILILALLCALLPQTVLLASAETYSGTCGENLSWSFDEFTGVLTIIGSGNMMDYSQTYNFSTGYNETNAPWMSYIPSIKSVKIEKGVTSIGANAFTGCTALTSISIPDSISSIADAAFESCGMTSIVIPDSVKSIGNGAFYSCSSLTSITIPDSVTSIGIHAFEFCSNLMSVTIGSGVTTISDYAFGNCYNLTSVMIPDSVTSIGVAAFISCGLTSIAFPYSVTSIGDGAFWCSDDLTDVTIPDSVTSIGKEAFYYCFNLTSITIPDSVTYIGEKAFYLCSGLTSILVDEDNSVYDSRNNCNAIIETATNTLIIGCGTTVIPNNVTSIADLAISDCDGLTSITIPGGLTSIGREVFCNCPGLISILVEEDNPVYDSRNNCNAIIETATNTLIIGCGTTVIPNSVTSIGVEAFFCCTDLESIKIPNSVTTICDRAFDCCFGLTDVYFIGTEEEWNSVEIGDLNDSLLDATIHFVEPHTHNYTATVTPPSCTEEGYTTYTCACGDSYAADKVPALGHNYVDGVCSRCSAKDPNYVPPTPADPCEGYSDIKANGWYYSAAQFVIERGLMGSTSTSEQTFEPNTKLSRAMVASILYRLCDSPAVAYQGTFTDVKNNKWFTSAIEWAAQNGLAAGKGDGTFDPNGNVTRQELAVFMKKTAEYLEKNTSGRNELSSFADSASVPKWAREYVQWAVDAGLISGKASGGKTLLAPTDTATRAEFASIIMRFVQNIAEAG